MKRTALRGHALRGEGAAYVRRDEDELFWSTDKDPWVKARGWSGVGLCECGEPSPVLDTNNARKRWHADHKDKIRGDQS